LNETCHLCGKTAKLKICFFIEQKPELCEQCFKFAAKALPRNLLELGELYASELARLNYKKIFITSWSDEELSHLGRNLRSIVHAQIAKDYETINAFRRAVKMSGKTLDYFKDLSVLEENRKYLKRLKIENEIGA
jgi:hypothetical protein